ncbi:MAG: OmpA family protein [Pseudomonadota bacterium]
MLAACADWPDDYDITDWSDEPEVEGEVPGADEDFPSLGSVPEPPENVSTLEDIEQVEQSLTSDLQNAQHSSGNYQRAEDEVEFEPVPVPEPEVIEEEVEEDNDLFGFFDLDGETDAEATETVETVTVVEEVEVQEVETVTTDSGELVAEEVVVERTVVAEAVVEETAVEEAIVEETVVEETVSDDVMTEETVVAQAVEDEADRTSPSLVAQSERDGDNADAYAMPDDDIDEAVIGSATVTETAPTSSAAVVEETVVAETAGIDGVSDETVVSETVVEPGEPKIQIPEGSPDDALPPQVVGRTVATEVAVAPAPTPSISGSMEAETVVVDDTVAEEVIVAAAPAVAAVDEPVSSPSSSEEVVEREVTVSDSPAGGVQQTFDTLFSESGADAVSAGSGAATVTASFSDAPPPTITANGFETLAAIIRFNLGSTALDNRDREIIGQLAAIYRERGGKIRLVGYASHDPGNKNATDEALVNFKISVDRATAVADELVRQGVPSRDIVVDAQGDQASAHLAQGQIDEAQQRRVDVYFTN